MAAKTSTSDLSVSKLPVEEATFQSLDQFQKSCRLTEVFDADRAQWILQNPAQAFEMLPCDRQHTKTQLDSNPSKYVKGWSETLHDLKLLLINSEPTSVSRFRQVTVQYYQIRNVGRRYAKEGYALARTQREIRQALAHPSMLDYDYKNCHPEILRWLCVKWGVKCKRLSRYCDDRDAFLERVAGPSRAKHAKRVLLSLLNSDNPQGTKLYNGTDDDSVRQRSEASGTKALKLLDRQQRKLQTRLKPFIKEMIGIQNAFAGKWPGKFKAHKESRDRAKKGYNYKGSFICTFLYKWESCFLDEIYGMAGFPHVCSLQYDGMQIACPVDCGAASKHIFKKFGCRIQLQLKPRKEALPIPDDIPCYKDPRFSFSKLLCGSYEERLADGRRGCSLAVAKALIHKTLHILQGGKGAMSEVTWKLETSSQGIEPWWRRVYEFVPREPFSKKTRITARIFNPKYDEYAGRSDDNMPFLKLTYWGLIEQMRDAHEIRMFMSHVFVPTTAEVDPVMLNLYCPPQWSLVDPIDLTAEQGPATIWKLMTNLCGGSEQEARHLLVHIADMVQYPDRLRRNAHIFISRQGAGKGVLAWFVSRLIGQHNFSIVPDAKRYFTRSFNSSDCDAILRVFEELEVGSQRAHSDPMKEEITRATTNVNQKYLDVVVHTNYARNWIFSNHEGSVYLELRERRYTTHRAVEGPYIDNPEFFGPIIRCIRDNDWVSGVWSFLKQYKYDVHTAERLYKNGFRERMMIKSEPKTIAFLKFIVRKYEEKELGDVLHLRASHSVPLSYDHCTENHIAYFANLSREFEGDTGTKLTSVRAVYSKLKEYGFATKRGRKTAAESAMGTSVFTGTYRDIHSIKVLRAQIAQDTGVKQWI